MTAIITMSTPGLYSMVLFLCLVSYVVGIIIRGILAERNEDNFRERIIEVHSAALKEVNHLRKDVRDEIAARKVAEQMIERLKLENATLQAHKPKTLTGGEPGFTEHTLATGTDGKE